MAEEWVVALLGIPLSSMSKVGSQSKMCVQRQFWEHTNKGVFPGHLSKSMKWLWTSTCIWTTQLHRILCYIEFSATRNSEKYVRPVWEDGSAILHFRKVFQKPIFGHPVHTGNVSSAHFLVGSGTLPFFYGSHLEGGSGRGKRGARLEVLSLRKIVW